MMPVRKNTLRDQKTNSIEEKFLEMSMQTVKYDDKAAQLKGISGSLTERIQKRYLLDDSDQSLAIDFTSPHKLNDVVDPIDALIHENFTQNLKKLENQQSSGVNKVVVNSPQKSRTMEERGMTSLEKEVELIIQNKQQLNLTPAKPEQYIADGS